MVEVIRSSHNVDQSLRSVKKIGQSNGKNRGNVNSIKHDHRLQARRKTSAEVMDTPFQHLEKSRQHFFVMYTVKRPSITHKKEKAPPE